MQKRLRTGEPTELPLVVLYRTVIYPGDAFWLTPSHGTTIFLGEGIENVERARIGDLIAVAFSFGTPGGVGIIARLLGTEEVRDVRRYKLSAETRASIVPNGAGSPRARVVAAEASDFENRAAPPEWVPPVRELLANWQCIPAIRSDLEELVKGYPIWRWSAVIGGLALEGQERLDLFERPDSAKDRIPRLLEGLLERHSQARIERTWRELAAASSSDVIPEREVCVSTEVATWCVFHPDTLIAHVHEPFNWWRDDDLISEEFERGGLLAVGTSSDGVFCVRVTAGPLTDREERFAVGRAEFRLRADSGRLFVGTPDHLPHDGWNLYWDDLGDPQKWLSVPRGDYRAIVTSIAWDEEDNAFDARSGTASTSALCAYALQLELIDSLESVAPARELPVLAPAR